MNAARSWWQLRYRFGMLLFQTVVFGIFSADKWLSAHKLHTLVPSRPGDGAWLLTKNEQGSSPWVPVKCGSHSGLKRLSAGAAFLWRRGGTVTHQIANLI